MKSTPPRTLLTVAAAMLGMGSVGAAAKTPTMRLHAPAPVITPNIRRILRPISQSPHRNQRKIRQARRQRWAAGDRKAFR